MFREYLLRNWLAVVLILGLGFSVRILDDQFEGLQTTIFSTSAVSMLATVVGIFLVFRFNNAYERWWEARILWGQLVNSSRSFARQVGTLLSSSRLPGVNGEEGELAHRRRLIQRHLAYVNALRVSLRGQDCDESISRYLDAAELRQIKSTDNIPRELLLNQAEDLAKVFGTSTAETLLLTQLDTTLSTITDVQGSCERIKNTAFPDMVSYISKLFVWGMALLMPAVFLEPDENIYFVEMLAVLLIGLAFIIVHQLAVSLMNPFDNNKNDTPMSALCITIERDLLTQLGETELPVPLKPVNGVLM